MKYDIDSIRCYQSVMFNRTNETFFATRQINSRQPLEIKIIEGLNVISLKSEKDHNLIPFANISAIYLKSPIKKEQEEKDKKERAKSGKPFIPKRQG